MNVETFIPNKLFVLKNFLSEAQCGELISRAESLTFSEAMISARAGQVMDKTVRNNDRILFDDHALAKSCYERAEPFLVRRWFSRKLLSFNERWRFYRYEKGQQFRPHYDGRFVRNEQEQSEFTFLVYLNDDFQGGSNTLSGSKTHFHLATNWRRSGLLPQAAS